jgi:hypothetical protein
MTLTLGHGEDRHFIRFDAQILGDTVGKRRDGKLIVCGIASFQPIGERFEFRGEAFAHGPVKGDLN